MAKSAVERLSAGQKDCLRLVLQGYEFKEIARLLGTSPGAINERLREGGAADDHPQVAVARGAPNPGCLVEPGGGEAARRA